MTVIPFLAEQLHKDVEVFDYHLPATELVGAVPATRQLLLSVPAGAAAHPCDILTHADHHSDTPDRGARTHSR